MTLKSGKAGNLLGIFTLALLFWTACDNGHKDPNDNKGLYASEQTAPTKGDWVVIQLRNEPGVLNPYLYRQANSAYIMQSLFQSLMQLDPKTEELVPVLAVGPAEISADSLSYTFEIKPEATWPDGSPITAKDVEFSIKVFKNPKVDAAIFRGVCDFLSDVVTDPSNPKKVTFVTSFRYFLAESSVADLWIIPRYVYDPEGLLDPFSVAQLNAGGPEIENNESLKKFADQFHDEKYSRSKGFVVGSGPYLLEEWVTDQTVKLKRNPNWWGDKLVGTSPEFEAWPEMLVYKIIKDPNTAVNALKSQEIDVMTTIPAKDFVEMQKNPRVTDHYELSTPDIYMYSFIGLNDCPSSKRTKFFGDSKTRRAFAHALDINLLIDKVYYGFGKRCTGPVLPFRKEEFDPKLNEIPFDLDKAAALLAEAGWKDSNGDGILEKDFDGEIKDFEFEFLIISGVETADKIALIFQEALKKIGVKMTISAQDFQTCSERYKNHDFDMFALAYGGHPVPTDLKQIWHTESWAGGSNYVCFGNSQTDQLIDAIRTELDPAKRKPLYLEFQKLVYDQTPLIFVMIPQEKIAVHKRFRNSQTHSVRPGFKPSHFWTPTELVKFK